MQVTAIKDVFVEGSLRMAGDVFEFNGKSHKYLQPVDAGPEQPVDAGPTKEDDNPMTDDELRVRLAEYGVKVHHKMKRSTLIELLDQAEGRIQE